MDQLIPSLAHLVAPFRDCFRIEVFQTFQALIAGWIVCLGPHTISAVVSVRPTASLTARGALVNGRERDGAAWQPVTSLASVGVDRDPTLGRLSQPGHPRPARKPRGSPASGPAAIP